MKIESKRVPSVKTCHIISPPFPEYSSSVPRARPNPIRIASNSVPGPKPALQGGVTLGATLGAIPPAPSRFCLPSPGQAYIRFWPVCSLSIPPLVPHFRHSTVLVIDTSSAMSGGGWRDLLCGAAFGSALYAAGVFAPGVVGAQLKWTKCDLLRAFVAASGSSALILRIADTTGYMPLPVRQPRSLGVLPYDANVLGGILIGAGMALTGACPGTVFVQVAASVASGMWVLVGGLFGGWLFDMGRCYVNIMEDSGDKALLPNKPWAMLVSWEAMCITALWGSFLIDKDLTPSIGSVTPIVGGLFIGLAQALSIILCKTPLGASAAYEDCGRFISALLSIHGTASKSIGLLTPATTSAAGMIAGAWLLAQFKSSAASLAAATSLPTTGIRGPLLALSGATMILGSRIAGGCTSGHGISGMSAFSPASMVTTAAMFAAGTIVAKML
ncbi:hypothetical protein ANO11243_076300 [Dothideomycetidae sp. 11243]|nr:hypothetical protein ANO11243_076300 [fungal sp. No.11243]